MISKKTKIICALIFLVHLSIAHFFLPHFHSPDAYPFYDWDLFSFTPTIQKTYFVSISSLDGKKINPPDMVFLHRDLYPGRHSKILPPQIIRLAWYLSEDKKEDKKILFYKTELEKNLFYGHHSAEYDVNSATINIRETLKTKQISSYKTLATYEFHQ